LWAIICIRSVSLFLPIVSTRFSAESFYTPAAFARWFSSCLYEVVSHRFDHLLHPPSDLCTAPSGVVLFSGPSPIPPPIKKMKLAISIKSKYVDNIKVPKDAGASAQFFANRHI
jgi:hypothetical protein